MAKFIPGLRLCELFYREIVKDLLKQGFPNLKYSAGLIDYGSEVLGFDTERSTDHHWGPRLMLFLSEKDYKKKKHISEYLSKNLPPTFKGYSTHYSSPNEIGVQTLSTAKKGQYINHRVKIYTIKSFFKDYLLIDISKNISSIDWLTMPDQRLRTIRSGEIFFDQIGINKARKTLNYYPKDVWLYTLASEWAKIGQEAQFVGRCGEVGDELGSKVIVARLVQTIMRLCFLMEKEYAPYSKWFGYAFSKLKIANKLSPILDSALKSETWKEREKNLSQAYEVIAKMHNDLKITKPLPVKASNFYDRPYLVIHGDVFQGEIKKKIKDKSIRSIMSDIGSISQITNTVDLLDSNEMLGKIKALYT